jgi:hypothetical protein
MLDDSPLQLLQSTNLLHDLPFMNSCGLVSKGHLQAHTLCGLNDGFDGCLYDPAARQFQQNVVADFMFAHLSTLLDGFTAGRFKTCIKAVSLVNGLFGSFE